MKNSANQLSLMLKNKADKLLIKIAILKIHKHLTEVFCSSFPLKISMKIPNLLNSI